MKNTKKICKPYTVWDYELEVCELNRESENGWQLVHGGLFHRTYEKDNTVVFRYQLDYNNRAEGAYYEMFQEQGWEYVNSTFNGWNYFRKPYDEMLDESEYLIYSDKESKEKMHSKFFNIMLIIFLAAMLANFQHLYSFIETPKIASSGVLLFYGLYIAMLVKAKVGLSRTCKGIVPKKRSKVELYFLLLVVSLVFMISDVGISFQTQVDQQMDTTSVAVERTFYYESPFPDVYYIDIEIEEDQIVELIIENEDDKIIYKNDSFGEDKKRGKVFLRSGRYECIINAMSDVKYTLWIE